MSWTSRALAARRGGQGTHDAPSGPRSPGGSRAGRRPLRAGGDGPGGPDPRYGLLLLLLIVTYLLSASGLSEIAADLQILLFFGVVLLALRTVGENRRMATLTIGVAVIGSIAAGAAALTHTAAGDGLADLWKGLILLLTAVLIVRRVLQRPTITVQSIYGALSAYLIVGLMFAAFYGATQHLHSGHFFANGQPDTTQTFQYFSFTTLTTLGYGDFVAADNGGRALAVIEALSGQIFLATLVARLVAAYRSPAEQTRPEPPGRRAGPPAAARRGSRISYHRRPRETGGRAASRPSARDP